MSQRSFEEIWQELHRLKGKTVETLCYGMKNDIVDFKPKKGMIRISHAPQATGDEKTVPKNTFKTIWEGLLKNGEFKPSEKSGWRIACACIAHLPEVEYSCDDRILCLYLMDHDTHDFCEVKKQGR